MRKLCLFTFAAGLAVAQPPVPNAIVVMRPTGAVTAGWKIFQDRYGAFDCLFSGDDLSPARLANARVLFLDHPSPQLLERLKAPALSAIAKGLRVVSPTPEMVQRGWGVDMDVRLSRRLLPYWENGGPENMANFFAALYVESGGAKTLPVPPPVEMIKTGVYHPDSGKTFPDLAGYLKWYRSAKPRQGGLAVINFFHSNWKNQDMAVIDALIRGLERQGLAAAAIFGWPHYTTRSLYNGPPSDPVRLLLSFTLGLSRPEDRLYLQEQNVHVIGLFTTRDSYAEWEKSDRGVSPGRLATTLSEPERNGATDPILVGTTETTADGSLSRTVPIAERIEMAARRAHRWMTLGRKPNQEKRLVVLYYNNPPGKGNVGASYLNLAPSLLNVLARLRREGYRSGANPPSANEILDLIQKTGRNVELWAPGEMTRMLEQGGVTLLPMHRYRQWFDSLPRRFRDSVNARWGPPEKAELMAWKAPDGRRYFVIPGFRLENVFIGPQLLRASFAEYTNVQHSATLPPHHGYIASYLFYRHQLQADAIVHMGRHGTLEWLPGKNAGQAGWDASEVLLGDLPNVNYYIMDGDGEALQARRRSAAVDLSHLTPMLARTGRESRFESAIAFLSQWAETRETSPALAAGYAASAWKELDRLGVTAQIPLDRAKGDLALEEAASFLEKLEDSVIPLGLPTLGESPSLQRQREAFHAFQRTALQPEEWRQVAGRWGAWTDRIFDGEAVEAPANLPEDLRNKLNRVWAEGRQWLSLLRLSAARELDELPRILRGEYLPSGLVGDPLKVPDALPSGRNLHQGDPAQWPTPAAWELGKRLAHDLLESHWKRDAKYPERISMVLWQGETGRHQGAMEAQALFLMGVEPRWNARGVVDGLRLIPDSELGHPRVNVVFTASGLYRDGLADKIILLDRAARLAATAGNNAIRRQNDDVEKALLARGVALERARELAGARVFAAAPGSYGLGLSQFVEQSRDKEEPETMAQLYLSKMNYAYTEKSWGATAPALLENHLRGNELIVHSRSSNLYGSVDNDDVYQWMGGLRTASETVGSKPRLLINNLRRAGQERVEEARTFLMSELHARNWNPKWIAELQKEGYAGGRLMARSIENLYGWQATAPEVMSPTVWKTTYEVYIADSYGLGLSAFFDKANPAAKQELVARLLEVDRQGSYKFTPAEKRRLVQEYARLVSRSGVACTANVCGNARLQQSVLQEARSLGIGAALSKEFRRAAQGSRPASAPAADPYRGMKVSMVKIRKVTETARRLITENPLAVGGALGALGGLAAVMALHRRRRRMEWAALQLDR
ncbi:MAG TPA: cobaltochelatase subunit CobN [Bryobacteraceae bacterium]|nr:cobaltochelatase subunit CobN [Bryobacteraceae bacterium]